MTTLRVAPPGADLFDVPEIRIEGNDKVSGKAKYTADVRRPHSLWAAFATSPFAHARILRIETTEARSVEGVRAVLTGADIGRKRYGRNLYDWPVLCYDVVRFVGDRVAAVAAETREAAERAAALIDVEYEELPAVFDPFAALEPDAPVLHPDRSSYYFKAFVGKELPVEAHPNVQGGNSIRKGEGDIEAIFASAHRVFEHTFSTPRQHAGYIEPCSTIVWIDGDGTVHVTSPNKQPFTVREQLAHVSGLRPEQIVIEPSSIGGDFGGKGLTQNEIPCYFLAKATNRPVRYVENYAGELRASTTRHPAHVTLKTAVDERGAFLAHQAEVVYNGGAYAGGKPGAMLTPGNGFVCVPYQIPNAKIDIAVVYTNTQPTAHVRAPCAPQVFFAWEQHVDMIAQAFGIDSLEFRLRNCVKPGDTFPSNEKIKSANAEVVLQHLQRELGPLAPEHGRGIGLVVWHLGSGKTGVTMTLSADGSVDVMVGVPDQGAGAYTVVRRVAAATLGIAPEAVRVRRGSTSDAPQDPGAGASRVTHIVGGATEVAARLLLEQIAEKLGRRASIADAARVVCADGPLQVVGSYDGTHAPGDAADFTFTAMGVDVDVDRETGAFRIAQALLVTDVGQIINPIAHQGQIDGGFVYGLGNAVMEEMPLDESGKVTTLSLGDYKLPTMKDVPPFRTVLVEVAAGDGPYGAKSAGELGNTAVPAAIGNAIADATGIRLHEYPITAERIFHALATCAPQGPL